MIVWSRVSNLMWMMRVFGNIEPWRLVKVDGCFRGSYCLPHQGDEISLNLMSIFKNATVDLPVLEMCGSGNICSKTRKTHNFNEKRKTVPQHTHGGAKGGRRNSSYSFSTSVLDEGKWLASRPGRALPPAKGSPVPIGQGGWVGHRACLDSEVRGKILLPLTGFEPRSPGRPVCSQTLYWLSYPGSVTSTQTPNPTPEHNQSAILRTYLFKIQPPMFFC
jgi:hypothetical protein